MNVITEEKAAMKDALTKVLEGQGTDDSSVDRIMAASFFRTRPMQAGTIAPVILLSERRTNAGRADSYL